MATRTKCIVTLAHGVDNVAPVRKTCASTGVFKLNPKYSIKAHRQIFIWEEILIVNFSSSSLAMNFKRKARDEKLERNYASSKTTHW